ncbi:MAG: DNA-binding NarL/FixJ family response regulator [Lentisphaeria bacterium]
MSKNDSQTAIALFSKSNSIQTRLLALFIEQQVNLSCNVIRNVGAISEHTKLVLVDCCESELGDLNNLVRSLNGSAQHLPVSLINVDPKSDQENLLDWPCVSGLFYNDTDEEQLKRGLTCLLGGDYWVPRRLLHHFFDKNRQAPSALPRPKITLTNREKEILEKLKDGAGNAEIAYALEVSERTVKSHLYNAFKKIGARNRREARTWAKEQVDIHRL